MGITCVRLDEATESLLRQIEIETMKSKSDIIRTAIDFFLYVVYLSDDGTRQLLLSYLRGSDRAPGDV